MIRNWSIVIVSIVLGATAWPQNEPLGPHDVNGSGCVLCHVPTATRPDAFSSDFFWAHSNVTPELVRGTGMLAGDRPLYHTFVCLTCHDGDIARLGMLGGAKDPQRAVLEPNSTIVRVDNNHPVHVPYLPNDGCDVPSPTCNPDHWPSTVNPSGTLTWAGDKGSENFDMVYGRPVRLYPTAENGGRAMVECSTCHNPHSLQNAQYKLQGKIQNKPSKAFIRGWYETEGPYIDTVSKFCRSCHYDKAADFVNLRQ